MYEIHCSEGANNMFGGAAIVMQTEFHAQELIAGMIAHLRKTKHAGTISLYDVANPIAKVLATWRVEVVTTTRVHYSSTYS